MILLLVISGINGSGINGYQKCRSWLQTALMYYIPSIVDDLTVKASYNHSAGGEAIFYCFRYGYAGVEGLTVRLCCW